MSKTFNKDVLSSFFEEVLDYRGKTPKKLNSDWTDKGYRAISANNVKTNGLQKLDSIRYVDQITYDKWMKIEIERGDLLLTSEAPAGEVMIWDSDEKIVLSQRLFGLRVNDRIYNKYLKYYLQSDLGQKEILRNTSGSTVFGISAKMFDLINVHYPEKNTQILIGDLLSDLDAKIEVNNKINQQLEALAKTIYDYWFVQFDFPDQNGKPYKSSGGKMVYNEDLKREIPEGWEVKSLGEIAEIKRGKLVTEKTANLLGHIKVVSAGIDYSYLHDESNREKYTITVSGSGANAGFVNFWREPIFANDCSTVRGNNDFETFVILQFLKLRQEYIFKQARGSAQPHVYPKDLASLKILIPNSNLFESYGKKVLALNEKISNNDKENQKLATLRDWLLPMLMNGQVTVGEAKTQLGMVAENKETYKQKLNE